MKKFLVSTLALCCFLFSGCDKQQEENTEKNLGSVVNTTVEVLVSFFNDEINENSGLSPLASDTPKMENDNYRYELEDSVYLTVTTKEKPSAKDIDFVKSMQICFSEDDDNVAAAYAKLLVLANNNNITSEEADKLVTEAKKLSNGESSNNGKGISVKYTKVDNHYEYQVIRNNK